jgi:CheY-like chemotaxis protein
MKTSVSRDVEAAIASAPGIANSGTQKSGPGPTVLLAEADLPLRAVLQQVLAVEGYDVQAVATVDAALRFARTKRPAAIVPDMELAGSGGATLTRRLRADPRTADIPLIALDRHAAPHPMASLLLVQARLGSPLDLAQLCQDLAHWTTAIIPPATQAQRNDDVWHSLCGDVVGSAAARDGAQHNTGYLPR